MRKLGRYLGAIFTAALIALMAVDGPRIASGQANVWFDIYSLLKSGITIFSGDYTTTSAGTATPLLVGVQGGGVGSLPIAPPDAGNISSGNGSGTCAAACNGTNLLFAETSGFGGLVTIDFITYGGTATLNFQQSNDNSTWRALECYSPGRMGTQTAAINAATAVYFCTAQLRYVRVNYGAYTSGTQTVFWNLRQNPVMPVALAPGINYGAPITAASGTQANAAATATLAAAAGRTTYVCSVQWTSTGATAPAVVAPTITGTITGTLTYEYATVAGVTAPNAPLTITFTPCVPASAQNTAIVATLPALGAGNTNAASVMTGYQL